MRLSRKAVGSCICGSILGAMLSLVAPSKAMATGETACKCDDNAPGSGAYQCNFAQDECVAGTETCTIKCGPIDTAQ